MRKTSLTQSLRGEALHYKKTQAIEWSPMAIDTPGEYGEPLPVQRPANQRLRGRRYRHGVKCRRPVVALFSGFTAPMNRPTIGPVTKADLAEPQRISLVAEWLTQAGAQQILLPAR